MVKFAQLAKQVSFVGTAGIKKKLKKALLNRLLQQQPEVDCLALRPSDVESARLFATRSAMVEAFSPLLQGKRIAELGVAYGDFSEVLIKNLEPEQFFAFDTFTWHQGSIITWGKRAKEVLGGLTHREFYANRFSKFLTAVVIEEGDGATNLGKYPDKYFDMIYVDGDHSYQSVKRDAAVSKQKLKDDGILIFNDYIMFEYCSVAEPNASVWYGVVQVVNQLVVYENFEVIGFALSRTMHCDIAVRRRRSPR
jgi:hypothetical protein